MSYEYTHTSGSKMVIRDSAGSADRLFVQIGRGHSKASMHILKADAPTVAAELLKAAGQESIIIPKAYEEVERKGGEITCGSGPEQAYGAASWNPNWLYNKAANYVALAQWIEGAAAREAAEKAEAEAAEKKLQERRDALATKFLRLNVKYNDLGPSASLRPAIDRIIELEDGASRD